MSTTDRTSLPAVVREHLETMDPDMLAAGLASALPKRPTQVLTSTAQRSLRVTAHPSGGCYIGIDSGKGKQIAGALLRPEDRDALIRALADTQRWGVA